MITSYVPSLSTLVKKISEVSILDLGTDEFELVNGRTCTAGLSVINLYHGFGVIPQASSFRGR